MKRLAVVCLGLITSTGAQAQVIMYDQYGNPYAGPYVGSHVTPGGVVTGINPYNGAVVTGHMPARPAYPESDPSMFGQVRGDGSIIGLDQ
jgi:hypothetical protein